MKKTAFSLIIAGVLLCTGAEKTCAEPMDLSGFSVLEGEVGSVMESGGTITFAENYSDIALYFYNDFFDVDPLATTLSFDYEFLLGDGDEFDYLQFSVDFVDQWYIDIPGSGHVEFDLFPYRGSTISIDWGLIWGGDDFSGTTASVSNINIETATQTAPVPEPATMLLFGTGLLGMAAVGRKRKHQRTS